MCNFLTENQVDHGIAKQIKSLSPLSLLILYAVIVGAAFALSKIALGEGISPTAYVFWQCLGAGSVCLAIGIWKRAFTKADIPFFLFCLGIGITGYALPNSIMIYSLQEIPAGTMGVLISTIPLFTVIFTIILRIETMNRWIVSGILTGAIGVAILFLPMLSTQMATFSMDRLAIAFLTPILFAITGLFVARFFPKGMSPLAVTAAMLLSACVILFPVMLYLENEILVFDSFNLLALIVVIQIVVSSLSYILYFQITQLAGATYMSQGAYLVPISAVFWSILLLQEQISISFATSAACIFCGLVFVNKGRQLVNGIKKPASETDKPSKTRGFQGLIWLPEPGSNQRPND